MVLDPAEPMVSGPFSGKLGIRTVSLGNVVALSRIRCGAHGGELDAERGDLVRREQREKALGRAQQSDNLTREHQRIVRGYGPEMLVDALLCFEGQLAQAFADILGDRNRSVLRQRDRRPPRALGAIGLDQAQHAKTRGQLPSPMPCDGALQFWIAFGEPLDDEVIHEGLGRSFQRLPLLGVRSPDGSVELLRSSYDGDGKGQALAQAHGRGRSLRDLGRDQLCLVFEDEANDPLGFLQRRDVLRCLRGRPLHGAFVGRSGVPPQVVWEVVWRISPIA